MPDISSRDSLFRRQVVVRISPDDLPLLERAVAEHGSIQAALIAGLHALQPDPSSSASSSDARSRGGARAVTRKPRAEPDEWIRAPDAARILGLKPDTLSAYIRSGRLPGYYDDTIGACGWVTTRTAVDAYRPRLQDTA